MERDVRAGRPGLVRKVVAFLTLAVAVTVAVVLLLPPAASSKSACPGIHSRVRIKGFDPPKAKAGSDTVVTVWGSHLDEVLSMAVGPKGRLTYVMFVHADNVLQFEVPADAVSGPIWVWACLESDRSQKTLRV